MSSIRFGPCPARQRSLSEVYDAKQLEHVRLHKADVAATATGSAPYSPADPLLGPHPIERIASPGDPS